jgi:hypothetical protein
VFIGFWHSDIQENRTTGQIAEKVFEKRSAFGEGNKVVNIFIEKETQI